MLVIVLLLVQLDSVQSRRFQRTKHSQQHYTYLQFWNLTVKRLQNTHDAYKHITKQSAQVRASGHQ